MSTFNARLDELAFGKVVVSMPYSLSVSQQHQFFMVVSLGPWQIPHAAMQRSASLQKVMQR